MISSQVHVSRTLKIARQDEVNCAILHSKMSNWTGLASWGQVTGLPLVIRSSWPGNSRATIFSISSASAQYRVFDRQNVCVYVYAYAYKRHDKRKRDVVSETGFRCSSDYSDVCWTNPLENQDFTLATSHKTSITTTKITFCNFFYLYCSSTWLKSSTWPWFEYFQNVILLCVYLLANVGSRFVFTLANHRERVFPRICLTSVDVTTWIGDVYALQTFRKDKRRAIENSLMWDKV